MSAKQARLRRLLMFLLRFMALAIPMYIVIALGIGLAPLQLETARESHALLSATGFNSTAFGAGVSVDIPGKPPLVFVISEDCTGWKAFIFLTALVVAVQRPWKLRLACIIPGIAAMWALNIARVVAIVYVYSSQGMAGAMLAHDYAWQIGFGAAALLIWAVWLKLTRKAGK